MPNSKFLFKKCRSGVARRFFFKLKNKYLISDEVNLQLKVTAEVRYSRFAYLVRGGWTSGWSRFRLFLQESGCLTMLGIFRIFYMGSFR
jgi:hypothetical protein